MRVKPSLLTGILVLLGYLAVVFTVWIIAGVDYDEVGDTVDNVRNVIAIVDDRRRRVRRRGHHRPRLVEAVAP